MFALAVLKNRNFRHYFLADIISCFGSGMSFIGANWLVLKETGSSASVGLLLVFSIASGLLIFPFAGTIADRFSRRTIIFWSNLVRALFITIVAVTFFGGVFRISFLYLLAIISGMGFTVFIPSSRGLVQELLQKDDLIRGNSLIEISLQVGMFTAAATAGVIYKYFGFGVILVIDAATFIISNIFLMRIKYSPVIAHDRDHTFRKQFVNGVRYLFGNPGIFGLGIVGFLPFVATMVANVVLPGYVSEHLKRDSVVFGLADMSYGVGACLSGFVAATLAVRLPRIKVVTGFFLISTAALIFLTANRFVAGLYVASLIVGLCNSSLRIIINTMIMEVVPTSFMGRAMAVWMAISMVVQSVSAYAVGLLIDVVPTPFGFLCMAAIMVIGLAGVCYFISKLVISAERSCRNLNSLPLS